MGRNAPRGGGVNDSSLRKSPPISRRQRRTKNKEGEAILSEGLGQNKRWSDAQLRRDLTSNGVLALSGWTSI